MDGTCRHGRCRPPQSYMQRSGGGRTDGTCRHDLRRPPQSYMQRSGGGRTHGTCRHGRRRPPRSYMQRSGGGRTDGTCRHGLRLRDGRRLGVARSAGHQRFLGLSCGAQLKSMERHCYAAASVGAHLQPHSRPSRLRCHIAAARGHSAVRRLPGARIYDIAGLRAHGGELHIYPARTYSQSVSYPTGERTGHVFRVHR